MGSFEITRQEDGTLVVPSRAEGDDIIGDGVRTIPTDHPEYDKFFAAWKNDIKLTNRRRNDDDER